MTEPMDNPAASADSDACPAYLGPHDAMGPDGSCAACGSQSEGAEVQGEVRCPCCGSTNVGVTSGNAVGNSYDCLVCFTDFTPAAVEGSTTDVSAVVDEALDVLAVLSAAILGHGSMSDAQQQADAFLRKQGRLPVSPTDGDRS